MYQHPTGRGRHMVLPAWMTRGPQPVGATATATSTASAAASATQSTAAANSAATTPAAAQHATQTAPAGAGPSVLSVQAGFNGVKPGGVSAPVSSPAASTGVHVNGKVPDAAGPVGKWLQERSDSPGARKRSRSASRKRWEGGRNRDYGERRSPSRGRGGGRSQRSPRRSRSPQRFRSDRRSGERGGPIRRDYGRDRYRYDGRDSAVDERYRDRRRRSESPCRDRRDVRSPSPDTGRDEGLSAAILADRVVEARQMPQRQRESHRRDFRRWCGSEDFHAEDRHGRAMDANDFVMSLIEFDYKVKVTKRIFVEENQDHSFCVDFELIEGGKNQVVLYECRRSRLQRAYIFRDSEDLTSTKMSLDDMKKTRIYQKVWKYFCKKGVSDDATPLYYDYLHDPEIRVG